MTHMLEASILKVEGQLTPKKRGQLGCRYMYIWGVPKIGVPQNGWFIMAIPIKMDDLGVPLF